MQVGLGQHLEKLLLRTLVDRLSHQFAFAIENKSSGNAFNVELLQAQLDKGEAEALVQAQEKDALYFIGDE